MPKAISFSFNNKMLYTCMTFLQLVTFLVLLPATSQASPQSISCSAAVSEITDLRSFGMAMTQGMTLAPEQAPLFEVYRRVFFGDPSVNFGNETLTTVTKIIEENPDLQKPHFSEYDIQSIDKAYEVSPELQKYVSGLSATAGQLRGNLFNPLANTGFWKRILNYKDVPVPHGFTKEQEKEFRKQNQIKFERYLSRVLTKENIEYLQDPKQDYQPKIKILFKVFSAILQNRAKHGIDTQFIRQVIVDLVHTTGFHNQATVQLLKSRDAIQKIEGLRKILDERDAMAMELGFEGHFQELQQKFRIPFTSINGQSDRQTLDLISDFEKKALSGNFTVLPTEVTRVRSLSIQEAPFRSCLGGSDCSSRTYFSKALDPNYNYFTMTDTNNHSSGHATVVLGEATDSKGNKIKIAFLDKLQNVPNQMIPRFLEAVRLSLSEKGYNLGIPDHVGDSSGLSNMDSIRNFIRSEINPKLAQVASNFIPHDNDYNFANSASRAYTNPTVRIYDLIKHEDQDYRIQKGRTYNTQTAPENLNSDTLIENFLSLRNSNDETDVLKFILSRPLVESLNKMGLYSEESFAKDLQSFALNTLLPFKIRKAAYFQHLLLKLESPQGINFSEAEMKEISSELTQWRKSSDTRKKEFVRNASSKLFKVRTIDELHQLLKIPGIDVNVKDDSGSTTLHRFAVNGNLQIFDLLLKIPGIDMNAKDNSGSTALHWAADAGRYLIIEALLKIPGIDVNAKDNTGSTALRRANKSGYLKIVELLKKAGAKE